MTLFLEGVVIIAGIMIAGNVGKRKYEDHKWRAEFPKRGVYVKKKSERMLLSHEANEKMTILSAFYGEHDVKAWISQNMDSIEWEFLVCDEIMRVGKTPDDTELHIAWQLDPV
jgi:hypothetical protein